MSDFVPYKEVIFKAQLGDGPVQEIGGYQMSKEEWDEQMSYCDSEEEWLQNSGSDWAYEAVHSDCLSYWAEFK